MTVEVARRRTRKTTKPASTSTPGSMSSSSMSMPAMAIGEIDQTIFACPDCARPLALGAHRCPGCGVHLLYGVQMKRASVFIGIGLATGLMVAVFVAVVTSSLTGGVQDPGAAFVNPTATATSTPASTPSSPRTTPLPSDGPTSTAPGIARSALTQAVMVDGRLAEAGRGLEAALAARTFDTTIVSGLLRSMSSDAVFGLQLAPHISSWSGGKDVGAALTTFYTNVQVTAGEGLSASIRNAPAYKAAAKEMVTFLKGLPALDEQVRAAATEAGVTLPQAGSPAP
jgi:hypothetical protein